MHGGALVRVRPASRPLATAVPAAPRAHQSNLWSAPSARSDLAQSWHGRAGRVVVYTTRLEGPRPHSLFLPEQCALVVICFVLTVQRSEDRNYELHTKFHHRFCATGRGCVLPPPHLSPPPPSHLAPSPGEGALRLNVPPPGRPASHLARRAGATPRVAGPPRVPPPPPPPGILPAVAVRAVVPPATFARGLLTLWTVRCAVGGGSAAGGRGAGDAGAGDHGAPRGGGGWCGCSRPRRLPTGQGRRRRPSTKRKERPVATRMTTVTAALGDVEGRQLRCAPAAG